MAQSVATASPRFYKMLWISLPFKDIGGSSADTGSPSAASTFRRSVSSASVYWTAFLRTLACYSSAWVGSVFVVGSSSVARRTPLSCVRRTSRFAITWPFSCFTMLYDLEDSVNSAVQWHFESVGSMTKLADCRTPTECSFQMELRSFWSHSVNSSPPERVVGHAYLFLLATHSPLGGDRAHWIPSST